MTTRSMVSLRMAEKKGEEAARKSGSVHDGASPRYTPFGNSCPACFVAVRKSRKVENSKILEITLHPITLKLNDIFTFL
jgi:hypothetical protein